MSAFKKIGVIGRYKSAFAETLRSMTDFLDKRKAEYLVGEEVAALLPFANYETMPTAKIGSACDLIIVLGGDGSLLAAARMLAHHNVPVLGINRGRLGFLTEVLPDQIEERVGAVLDGDYKIEKRFLLTSSLLRDGEKKGKAEALNDVVVNSGTSAKMIEFDLFIDDEFVYHQRSDGLIVSTPTGSTAYSLSGGGPIMHPTLDAVVLVPMFPHTLSSRPIVVDGNSEIKVIIRDSNEIHPPVICDGQVHLTAEPGDTVLIRKKRHKLSLIHPPETSFYASCRDKLGWSTRLGE